MKKIILLLLVIGPLILQAQQETAIQFETGLNWSQVREKARKENKPIFVDAFATWCAPCKKMDAEVYNNSAVAKFANTYFVSVKIQIDQTEKDSRQIKEWRSDAAQMTAAYHIVAVPTFLFISPNGELMYKGEGFYNPDQFISLLKAAQGGKKSYTGLVNRFKDNKIADDELMGLALTANRYHEDSLAKTVAKVFKKKVIDHSKPQAILSVELPDFLIINYRLFSMNDPLIQYIFENSVSVDDAVKQNGFSSRIKEYFVVNDLVNPIIKPQNKYTDTEPDWTSLEKKIGQYFKDSLTYKTILNAKLDWFGNKKDWPSLIKYNIEKVDYFGIDLNAFFGGGTINNMVFYVIFPHTNDPYALNKAISYMETLLKARPDAPTWLDTYANVLYRAGRKAEALSNEDKAIQSAIKTKDQESVNEFKETRRKMELDAPTWDTVNSN